MMGVSVQRCWMALILACVLQAAPGVAHAVLVAAEDLARTAQEARDRRVPVLLAFMQKQCPYCARARRYLDPLAAQGWGGRAILYEIDVDDTRRLRDFDGRWTTPRELARRHGVTVVPTVIVVDAAGRPLADPLRGIAVEDFYAFNLERALETAATKLQPPRQP